MRAMTKTMVGWPYRFLTVREHLGFHVATKLGSQASAKERLARVYEVRDRRARRTRRARAMYHHTGIRYAHVPTN